MNLFKRLFQNASTKPSEEKASAARRLIAYHGAGRPVWTPRNYAALASEAYARNAIAFRCVRMIAESAASIPFLLRDDGRPLTTHPLLELLARPNPRQCGHDLLESWYGYMQVAGNAYLEAVEIGGEVCELYVLRPDRMKIVPGAQGWPESYEYTVSGRHHIFKVGREFSSILHMAAFHPTNDHYGMSPLEVAANAVDIHNAAGAWNKALLDNAARPSGALVFTGSEGAANLNEEQFDRLKAELEDTYQGARHAGRPLLLDGGLDWKPMGLTPVDMDFINAKHTAAREIALAFGVPPMLMGIPGDNTYANYREANLAFWRQTVLPLSQRMAKALARWLGPRFGVGLELQADVEQVSALNLEREIQWRRLNEATFLTLNEKRAALGLKPQEGGNTLLVDGVKVPLDQVGVLADRLAAVGSTSLGAPGHAPANPLAGAGNVVGLDGVTKKTHF